MNNTCPLSTFASQSVRVPPVPAKVTADVPIVPQPSADIYGNQTMEMGGTTLPQESSRYAYSNPWDMYQVYQVAPPHVQNTNTPCSIIGKYPFSADQYPGRNSRHCYEISGTVQGVPGRICTTPGTDGPLFSREYPEGVNGNADWVRGNQFSDNYNIGMIENRKNYVYKTGKQVSQNPRYYSTSPFYPYPGYCRDKQAYVPDPSVLKPNYPLSNLSGRTYKTYPLQGSFTSSGKPEWTSPYNISYNLSAGNSEKYISTPITFPEIVENFVAINSSGCDIKCSLFWYLVIILMVSMLSFAIYQR